MPNTALTRRPWRVAVERQVIYCSQLGGILASKLDSFSKNAPIMNVPERFFNRFWPATNTNNNG